MQIKRRAVIHFLDGTRLALEWPAQGPQSPAQFATAVQRAIAAERWAVEVDGRLLVIQMKNAKYVEVSPVPEALPGEVMRRGRVVN